MKFGMQNMSAFKPNETYSQSVTPPPLNLRKMAYPGGRILKLCLFVKFSRDVKSGKWGLIVHGYKILVITIIHCTFFCFSKIIFNQTLIGIIKNKTLVFGGNVRTCISHRDLPSLCHQFRLQFFHTNTV